jgi:hypothetical protein
MTSYSHETETVEIGKLRARVLAYAKVLKGDVAEDPKKLATDIQDMVNSGQLSSSHWRMIFTS